MKKYKRIMVLGAASLFSIGAITACTGGSVAETSAAEAPSIHPVSGLAITKLTITSGKKRHVFRVEIAASHADQNKGLMFRTELGPNEGMIFPRNPPDYARFWMKNTPLPLDIIFIAPDGRIINIAENTTPYSLDSVAAEGVTGVVLEIPGGRSAELGLKPGDLVKY